MSRPVCIAVRLIGSGSVIEVMPDTPVVLLPDVFPSERAQTIYGCQRDYLTRTDARAWRAVAPSTPAYVADTAVTDEDGPTWWHLCEIPDAATLASAPTIPAPPSESGEWVSFGEITILGEDGDS